MTIPAIAFDCPHCGRRLSVSVDSKETVEDGDPVIDITCRSGVCPRCAKGIEMTLLAFFRPLSEHDIRKDADLYRIVEAVRDARDESGKETKP